MSPGQPFDVPVSGAVADLVRRLHDEAVRDGRAAEFLSALRAITDQLRTSADTFGEELFDLPGLGLTVRVAVVLPLAVRFTVHPGRLVTIGSVTYRRPG
jgi:hypothetical protein